MATVATTQKTIDSSPVALGVVMATKVAAVSERSRDVRQRIRIKSSLKLCINEELNDIFNIIKAFLLV